MLRALINQLLRDLKASWKKSAVLGLLLVVGCVLWVPPLFRAMRRAEGVPPVGSTNPPSVPRPAPLGMPQTPGGELTWKTVDRVLESDPLVRSAEVAEIRGETFRIDPDQFPPPILFAEDVSESKSRSQSGDSAIPEGLALKSTILGETRRAAYINKKLYFEGAEVLSEDGQTYLLKAVQPRKVVLEQAGQTFELKIADRAPIAGAGTSSHVRDDVK